MRPRPALILKLGQPQAGLPSAAPMGRVGVLVGAVLGSRPFSLVPQRVMLSPAWLGLGLGQVWGWAEPGVPGQVVAEDAETGRPTGAEGGPPLAQPGLLTDSLLFVSLLLDSLL